MYRYNRPLHESEIHVAVLQSGNLYDSLESDIRKASLDYGFTIVSPSEIHDSKAMIRHIIILDGWDNPREVYERHSEILGQCSSSTLAISYKDTAAFNDAGPEIEKLKKETLGKVNFLLPNLRDDGTYVPRLEKLIDNSICDSVRIKYKPKCLSEDAIEMPNEIAGYFVAMSKLIEDKRLYHRAETDGFIAIKGTDNSFYITCTKTAKTNLDLTRVSVIESYNPDNNVIHYKGQFLPSSDSVECATVFQQCPDIKAILHVHASKQLTRNPKFSHKIAIPPMRYGEAYLGDAIVKTQSRFEFNDFIIMDDHGELFFSREVSPEKCTSDIVECVNRYLE